MEYIIQDWAGNHMFIKEIFNSFDEAWEFIYKNINDEELYQDIYVIENQGN